MLPSIVIEVLDYRGRAPKYLNTKPGLMLKAVMVVASFIIPFVSTLVAVVYGVAVIVLMAVIGLRKASAYIAVSLLIVYLVLLASILVLGGDITSVIRFTAFAMTTAPVFVFTFATTRPLALRRIPAVYLLLVVLSSALKETVDIATSYRARGSRGLEYWLRVVVATVVMSMNRAQALADSLRSRGIDVVD